MRAAGEILKEKRLKAGIALEEVAQATKIRTRHLEALEGNDFAKIPGGAIVTKGFIKNYAEFLGLSSKKLLAIFRRDFRESKSGQIIPRGMVQPLRKPKFAWTPKMTVVMGLVALFLVLGGYLFYQYFLFLAPPPLTVSSPQDREIKNEALVRVVGRTDPDATLFINKKMGSLDENGSFEEEVILSPGENEIMVEAVSRRDKRSTIVRKVKYEP